jgi:ubiquinone biosynthesis protein
MTGFIAALIKQRKEAKKAEPHSNGRLREIIAVLKKYNYDDGITPEIIVNILEDLGPTFVKLGQIASQQTEYMPAEYSEALAKLRSKVAPMDMETVHAQIEKYLGKPVNELFATFSEKALGSASIAQVHKATLHDGTIVAVKVRRPGVVETVARDFALIEKVLDKFVKGNVGGIDLKGLITELEKTSKIELDLTNEANYLDRFYNNNLGRERVISPKCYRELTCEAVLTEDFVTGTEVSNTDYLATLGEDERERLASLIADNFSTQVLVDGFYHADPHSGNVFIKEPAPGTQEPDAEPLPPTPENASVEGEEKPAEENKIPLPEHSIEWIDFGMMGTLTQKQRQTLLDIVTNVVMKDAYGLKKILMTIAQPLGEVNHGEILGLCEDMCNQFSGTDFGDFQLGDLLTTVLDALQNGNYKVDPFLTNLSRGVIAIEGTVKTLSSKVNILNYFITKVDIGFDLDLENLDKEHLKDLNPQIGMRLLQLFKGVTDSSVKKAETLDMLQKGQIKIPNEFSFEKQTLETVNRLTSYAIRALIIVALIIGSTLLCTTTPIAEGNTTGAIVFRGVGIAGYIVSLFFAQRLYRNMRKGK